MKRPKEQPKKPLQKMLDEHALAHQRRHEQQVLQIEQDAKELARRMHEEGYSRAMALEELEAVRLGAMRSYPIQAAAAVGAIIAKARIMGLIIEKQAVMHGSQKQAGDFLLGDVRDNQKEIIADLRRRIGSEKFDVVMGLLTDARLVPPNDDDDEQDI
jgi:hypothetical protein